MLIHLGVVLLLVGQMLTDFLSRESALHLRIGETKNYSEAERDYELAVIDTTDRKSEQGRRHSVQPARPARRSQRSSGNAVHRAREDLLRQFRVVGKIRPMVLSQGQNHRRLRQRLLVARSAARNRDGPSGHAVGHRRNLPRRRAASARFWCPRCWTQPQQFTFNNHTYEIAAAPGAVLHAVQPAAPGIPPRQISRHGHSQEFFQPRPAAKSGEPARTAKC